MVEHVLRALMHLHTRVLVRIMAGWRFPDNVTRHGPIGLLPGRGLRQKTGIEF
jgi:hypothetical protein